MRFRRVLVTTAVAGVAITAFAVPRLLRRVDSQGRRPGTRSMRLVAMDGTASAPLASRPPVPAIGKGGLNPISKETSVVESRATN